jgi:intracellular sulfur oxidation DsrE/DsrF family protein
MRRRPVAVVPRFLSKTPASSFHSVNLTVLFGLYLLAAAGLVRAQTDAEDPRYLVAIELHTEEELLQALKRSEQLLDQGILARHSPSPVRFVLHGPEAKILLLQNYPRYKATVDLAARLSAFGVVDLKVCETWMGGNRVNPEELPPFVGTVPYGPDEIRRLMKEQDYIYF